MWNAPLIPRLLNMFSEKRKEPLRMRSTATAEWMGGAAWMCQKPLTVKSCSCVSHQVMQTVLDNSLWAPLRVTDPFWQGDILSPALFSLCMDDLSKRFKGWVYPGSKSGWPAALRQCLRPNVILLFDRVLWSSALEKESQGSVGKLSHHCRMGRQISCVPRYYMDC